MAEQLKARSPRLGFAKEMSEDLSEGVGTSSSLKDGRREIIKVNSSEMPLYFGGQLRFVSVFEIFPRGLKCVPTVESDS